MFRATGKRSGGKEMARLRREATEERARVRAAAVSPVDHFPSSYTPPPCWADDPPDPPFAAAHTVHSTLPPRDFSALSPLPFIRSPFPILNLSLLQVTQVNPAKFKLRWQRKSIW
ncbi:hypothetical protein B0H13DRAFT_1868019 [Mycena leptocephala]|nr:hypothetical protein B0H13DRAFT_1868019 [Mycena leptocephala]